MCNANLYYVGVNNCHVYIINASVFVRQLCRILANSERIKLDIKYSDDGYRSFSTDTFFLLIRVTGKVQYSCIMYTDISIIL